MRTRFLSLALLLCAVSASAAVASVPSAPTDSISVAAHQPAPPAFTSPLTTADTVPVMRMLEVASAHHQEPAQRSPLHPLSYLGLAAMGATAKSRKRPTRRASGAKAPDVPMYLDTEAHVMRDGDLVRIPGDVLVEDTELDDDEIADFIARGVIRPATPKEIARLEAADSREAANQLAAEQGQEMQQLLANQAVELAGAAEADKAKLAEKHLRAVSALQQKHAQAAAS